MLCLPKEPCNRTIAQEVPDERLLNLLDKEFVKDESLKSYVSEILLEEDDGMIDLLYEKQGSYLQGKAEGIAVGRSEGVDSRNRELAKGFRDAGVAYEIISRHTGLSAEEIRAV